VRANKLVCDYRG